MNITTDQVIVWLIVGALAGSLVGVLVKRSKKGFGRWINLAVGLAGAVIGGVLFKVLRIDLGLGKISITAEDLVAAIVGSVILLLGLWIFKTVRKKKDMSQ